MNSLLEQPGISSANVAYKPITFELAVDTAVNDCAAAFCDVYINGAFYKTLSKTQPTQVLPAYKAYVFDIQDCLQEYLRKFIAPLHGQSVTDASTAMASVFCGFRSMFINTDGFLDGTDTIPVQATDTTPAQNGTGLMSNTFFVINATLQHYNNPDIKTHLNVYKYGNTFSNNIFPLTHRPASCKIKLGQSDYYPIMSLVDPGTICLTLNYKYKDDISYSIEDQCGVVESVNLSWRWYKESDDSVDLTADIDGTFTAVDWGDGTVNTLLTHTYLAASDYTVKVYNSTATNVRLKGQSVLELIALPISLIKLYCSLNNISVIPSFLPLVNLRVLALDGNSISTIDLSACVLLETCILSSNSLTGAFDISTNYNLQRLTLYNNIGITAVTGIASSASSLAQVECALCGLDTSAVNDILVDLDSNGLFSGLLDLIGQSTPAPPSGAGITAKNNLTLKLWAVTTD